MPFVPNSFTDGSAGGTPITAATLNNLEQGVVAADITTPGSAAVLALDGLVAGYVGATTSATKTALGVSYVAPVAYVPAPTGVFATDTANILAAVNKLPTTGPTVGGVVVLRPGQYIASLPDVGNVLYQGQGMSATEVRCSSGSMLTTAGLRLGISFQDLTLSTTGSHLFELGSSSTGMANGRFTGVQLVTYVDGSSLFHGTGTCSFQSYNFQTCSGTRNQTATVPAFNIVSSSGGINCNTFNLFTAYSNFCVTTPFWRLEATSGSYCFDNVWTDIVGERNCGGLVHLYSPSGATFINVGDWDAGATNYADHLINIQTSATAGATPRGVNASNVGTRYGTMATGKNHFNCVTVPGTPVVLERIGDPNGTSKIPYIIGQSISDSWGAAGSVQFVTTSYTLNKDLDGMVSLNGTSLTATLPAPSALPYLGRKFTVKNINASALTVNATGGALIDGVASRSLAQWVAITVVSDGAAYFTV